MKHATYGELEKMSDYARSMYQKELLKDSGTYKAKVWDYLLECGICTEDELRLVTNINGYNDETMNDIIYAKTAYRDLEQLMSV